MKAADEALPRKNGELVFKAPWEGRIFGLAVAMSERGSYPWSAFSSHLAEEIASAPEAEYYQSWLAAFEKLLLESGVLSAGEMEERAAEYRALERDPVF